MAEPSETVTATMRENPSLDDPDRPSSSSPRTASHSLSEEGEDGDDDKVYIVPFRWLREALESSSSSSDASTSSSRGILYAASSISSSYRGAMKLINNFFNSDLVFSLRREEDSRCNDAEAARSARSYALVRADMWSQAMKRHYENNGGTKPTDNAFPGRKDNDFDTYALNLRISVARDADLMTVKISKKDNSAENYKRASKIFNIDSEMVQIWDFSGQTTLIFMNERNKVHQHCSRHADQENLLEIHVFGLIEALTCQNEQKREDLSVQQLKRVPTHDGSLQCNGKQMDFDSASGHLNGYASCGALDSLGLTGLENLGNTCFMNSAIQCLAHTPMLVEFFLGEYTKEINAQNPLGMNGELAMAFGEVIRKLWAAERVPVAPKHFKATLARFAPQFSGFNQHDSQELLAFLLDGLHEDLNRVKNKRYVEVKDALDRPDDEVADEYWENHLARNNSIIVDICQGQYRSTLVCPFCKKISVTFDPFMYLSLPLPSTTTRKMTVTVYSSNGIAQPCPYTITVPKQGKCKDLIASLAVACAPNDDETLLLAEVYNYRVIRYLDDPSDSISLIRDEDRIAAYQIPKDPNKSLLVVFMHQREEVDGDGKKTYQRFGVPLVSKLSGHASGSAIESLFRELARPFLKEGKGEEEEEIDSSRLDESLSYYVTDQRGQAMLSEIETGEDPTLENETSAATVYVLVCWHGAALDRYDFRLLGPPAEVHRSGPLSKQAQEESDRVSLYSCLEAFLKEEPLGPDDMWFCPGCKEHRQASKKLDLWRVPEILVIHLKRFSYSRYTKNKLETFVDFPVRDLDLSSYVARSPAGDDGGRRRPPHYALFAVSNHYGSMGGGHYTAFVHHAGHGQWYDFDDQAVTPMAEAGVKTAAAYVLFFKRLPETAPDS
ncbi:ubiquitin-specific protease 8 [Wolffia australiana]